MTTVDAPNVHTVAVEGTFDDCQDLVKAMFADAAVPRPAAAVGGELDQLGPGDGPGRLLRHRRAMRSAARPGVVQRARPATSATCSPAGSPGGWALPIDRLVIGSNRNDILTRFVDDRRSWRRRDGRADAQPEHGHPGVVELRAAAVRDERPRRRPARPSSCGASAPPGALDRRGRPVRARGSPPVFRAARFDDDRRARRSSRDVYADDRDAGRPAHGDRRSARPLGQRTRRACRSSRWRPPTRRSSPTPSSGPPASARRCRPTWPTCSTVRSAPTPCPTTSPPSSTSSNPSAASRADVGETPPPLARPVARSVGLGVEPPTPPCREVRRRPDRARRRQGGTRHVKRGNIRCTSASAWIE